VLRAGWGYADVSDKIAGIVLSGRFGWKWWTAFLVASGGVLALLVAVSWLLVKGIGIWGVDIPVAWGFAIGNFVWWIGIGHAGTFISAVLLLLRQRWRTSINRFAEAMTCSRPASPASSRSCTWAGPGSSTGWCLTRT
jgi:hypothetical protein